MINFLIKTRENKATVIRLLIILCLLLGMRSFAQTAPSTPGIWSSQTNGVVTIHWSTPSGTVTRYTLSEDAGSREYEFGVGTNSFKPSITGNGIWYSIRACSGASSSSCSPYSSYLPVNIPPASSSAPPSPSSSPKSSSPSSVPPVSSSSIATQPAPSPLASAALETDSINNRFTISWSNVSAYKFELQYSGAAETHQVGATWYVGPTLSSGTSTTVAKSSVTDFVYYQWRVRACNSSNVCSAWTTTRKKAFPAISVASATSLLSPVMGATEPLLPCFSWKLDPNALDATITVSTTTDFPEKRWQLSVGKDAEAACFNSNWLTKGAYPEEIGNPILVNGATYYWRVVTTMASGLAFTETRSFKASSAAQAAPAQPAFANLEADSANNLFKINWDAVPAYKYELQYSGSEPTNTSASQSSVAPTQLTAGGTQGWGQFFIQSITATGGTLKLNNADGVAGAIGVAGRGTTAAIDDEIQNGEALTLTLDAPVSDASFGFAKLDYNVSAGHQVGVWIAFLNGVEVGRSEFQPTDATRTGIVQVKNRSGNFIAFDQIRFEAIKPGSDYVVTSFSALRGAVNAGSLEAHWYAGPTLYSGASTSIAKASVTDFDIYRWRVRACNSGNACSAWTETTARSFGSSNTISPPIPILTVIDADQDCFYIINFNAPLDVPANYIYELYERKLPSTAWQQIVARSRSRGNIPPFTLYSDGDTLNNRHLQGGAYEFRARVCEDGTEKCGAYSTILPVNTSTSCSSVAMPIVKFEPLITTAVVGQDNVLSVSATTPQGTITQVSFYAGGELIGIDSSYPFSINWRPTTEGSTHIEAIAETSVGGTASTHYKFVTIVATSTVNITGMTASYSASPHGLKISWSQVTNATRYEVVRSVDGGATWDNRYSDSATHFVDTEIENHPGAIYYRVRACSSACSAWSTSPAVQ